jgi:hypothetical protein
MKREFVPGRYLHYKGNYYTALQTVKHSETEEVLVLYKPEHSDQWWVRPLTMFLAEVLVDGKKTPRFQLITRQ